ncbi:MAG: hypothetical protein IPM98_08835 [Lewinellaceae bacterium]|nr:hypothetical protein [Lewinellaceae bacterium]
MQKLLFLLAFICLSLTTLSAQRVPKIETYFVHNHTKTDLMNIREELSSMNITLEYTHIAFDADGRLTELAFEVDCKDGFKGSAKSDAVPSDLSFGFVRDYRKDATSAFSVGNLKEAVK